MLAREDVRFYRLVCSHSLLAQTLVRLCRSFLYRFASVDNSKAVGQYRVSFLTISLNVI